MEKYYFVELRAHSFSKTYLVSRCELHVALCLRRTSNILEKLSVVCVATLKNRRCTDECGRISTGEMKIQRQRKLAITENDL